MGVTVAWTCSCCYNKTDYVTSWPQVENKIQERHSQYKRNGEMVSQYVSIAGEVS